MFDQVLTMDIIVVNETNELSGTTFERTSTSVLKSRFFKQNKIKHIPSVSTISCTFKTLGIENIFQIFKFHVPPVCDFVNDMKAFNIFRKTQS